MPGIEDLAATAELLGAASGADLRARLDGASAFLNDLLLPHMEAAERVFYPELERMMQNRHSMTPMRQEHARIRARIATFDAAVANVSDEPIGIGTTIALRRLLFELYATLKIHLAEEQLYDDIVERRLAPEAEAELAAAMTHQSLPRG
jgi:iron-sulfur cluster repair protein YtfE (RIC family)